MGCDLNMQELIAAVNGLDDAAAIELMRDALYANPLDLMLEIWDAENAEEAAA
jgi:hypothetical protein